MTETDRNKAVWADVVANADLQIAAGTCPLAEDEGVLWANSRIKDLETELRDFAFQYIQCGCNHPHCSRCGDYSYILEKVLNNEAPHFSS